MKRVLSGAMAFVLTGAGQAAAASLLALPARSESPSIIMLGEAAPAPIEALPIGGETGTSEPAIYVISDSVIAMGADAIPAASEQVASINEPAAPRKPLWMGESLPLVIRGGMIGDPRPAPTQQPPAEQAAAGEPTGQQPGQRAARGGGTAPAPAAPDMPAPPVDTMR